MCTYNNVILYVFACIFVHSTYLYEEKNVMILYRVDNLILFAQGSHISIDIALYAAPGIVITPLHTFGSHGTDCGRNTLSNDVSTLARIEPRTSAL